jgi:hypothetical protein
MTSAILPTSQAQVACVASSLSVAGPSPEEQMLALIVHTQVSQMNGAKTAINLNADQLEKLREQVKKALEEAREAKKDAGFWGGLAKLFGSDLASIASAVAAVAAVIASGGAAAPILAAIAVAASFAAEHAEELGIPTEVAMGIAIAASVAAVCVGDTKGLFQVSEKVQEVARDVRTSATASAVAFKGEGVLCGSAAAGYERAARYSQADAQHADGLKDLASADMDEALDRLSAAFEHQNAATERASSILQQTQASNYMILNNWAGAA